MRLLEKIRKFWDSCLGYLLGWLVMRLIVRRNRFIPNEAWLAIHKAFNLPYVEIAIARKVAGRWQILLDYRDDEYFRGWHIPGVLWRAPWSLEEACRSAARSEGLGNDIAVLGEVMTRKWPDHPYGNPISHVIVCRTADSPIETIGKREFFSTIPNGMVPHHTTFALACFKWLNRRYPD